MRVGACLSFVLCLVSLSLYHEGSYFSSSRFQSPFESYLEQASTSVLCYKKVGKIFFEHNRHDLLHLAFALQASMSRNPDRHIFSILRDAKQFFVSDERKKLGNEIDTLIEAIRRPRALQLFPCKNLAYQTLIFVIKTWNKKDLHCHVSPSLSDEWVIETVQKQWSMYKEAFVSRLNDERWRSWREKNKGTVMLEAVKGFLDGRAITTIFESYENPTDGYDIPIVCAPEGNLDVFLDAVAYVVRSYFDDGVRVFDLRFNPCKNFNGQEIDPLVVLRKMHEVVQQEEARADARYTGPVKHCARFMFSFNQGRYRDRLGRFVDLIKTVVDRWHQPNSSFLHRVSGVDVSGMECDATRRSQWHELYNTIAWANEQGVPLACVCHGGDRWNVDEAYNRDFNKHLRYVYDALFVKNLSRVGHGNILCLDFKAFRLSEDESRRELVDGVTYEQKSYIEKIIKTMREKKIMIECLPKTEFQFITVMKKNPFYYWKKRNVPLTVGIDGTCYTQSTLSEWIAWLLLAAPEEATSTQDTVTVHEMQKMVLVSGERK